ncbi:MAG: hypothetical protein WCD44_03380 [Candidatus Babeliales bacterium]
MPKINIFYWNMLIMAFISSSFSIAMVYDNRFFPLFARPRIKVDGLPSSFAVDYLVSTASRAFDNDEGETGIPELFGNFDLATLGRAFTASGRTNPIRSDLQASNSKLPFDMEGKIQSQGVAFSYYQQLVPWLSLGFSWFFMRVNSRQLFILQKQGGPPLGPGDVLEVNDTRRAMFSALNLRAPSSAQLGFGDIDSFLRFGWFREYTLKFRRIDAGLSLGLLIPTGLIHELNSPASVPFGGNGHWGFYVSADALFELREDLKTGVLLRASKRLPNTKIRRMPADGEPQIFGTIVGPARVNPGFTFIFSPYFILENLRKGLGIGLYYTLTSHGEDKWADKRSSQTVPVKLNQVDDLSSWGSDYVTINVFYDFGKEKVQRSVDPIISFRWDIPANLFIAKRVVRTHEIALGVEFVF